MEEIKTSWALYFLVCFLVFALCYMGGKKKYAGVVKIFDKKDFALRDFFPAGFFLMEKTKYQYAGTYDRVLRKYVKELHDPKYCEFYVRAYWASAASYLLICVFLSGLLILSGQVAVSMLMLAMGPVLGYINLHSVEQKVEKRHMLISMDLPDFTNKIIILSGAGMTVREAIVRIAHEMQNDRPLSVELQQTVHMMENSGATPEQAFDYLVTKCNMPEMRRFVSIILQCITLGGGANVMAALGQIGDEQWTNRKNAARAFAETASTKMLFPMMLMLFAVIILTIAPAVMGM